MPRADQDPGYSGRGLDRLWMIGGHFNLHAEFAEHPNPSGALRAQPTTEEEREHRGDNQTEHACADYDEGSETDFLTRHSGLPPPRAAPVYHLAACGDDALSARRLLVLAPRVPRLRIRVRA